MSRTLLPLFVRFVRWAQERRGGDAARFVCARVAVLCSRDGNIFMYVFMKLRRETEERCRLSAGNEEGRGVVEPPAARTACPASPPCPSRSRGRGVPIGLGRCGPPNDVRGGGGLECCICCRGNGERR